MEQVIPLKRTNQEKPRKNEEGVENKYNQRGQNKI